MRLAETWQEYDSSQQDLPGLVTEKELEAEQLTFIEMEDIYKDAIDEENGIIKGKLRAAEGRKKSGAQPDKPTQDGDRHDKTAKRNALVDNLLDPPPIFLYHYCKF